MAAGNIGDSIRTYLMGVAAVTAVTNRMYSDVLGQGATLPAIVYRIVSGEHAHHLKGSANFGETVIQIDCIDDSHTGRDDADALAEIVRKNLTSYSGTVGGDKINNILASTPRYRYEQPRDGKGIGRFVHSRDYRVFHAEPAVST